MSSRKSTSLLALALLAVACGGRETAPVPVDCSVLDSYEFGAIGMDFTGNSTWYSYADPTPHPLGDVVSQQSWDVEPRCGDARALRLEAHGYNFWGAGFANYNLEETPANGTGYDGISFWARTGTVSDRTFMLYIDDGQTLKAIRGQPVNGVIVNDADTGEQVCTQLCAASPTPVDENADGKDDSTGCIIDKGPADTNVACTILPDATGIGDQDFDGDGKLGPGDIVGGTTCRIPPPQAACDPACYYGGAQPPAVTACVPSADRCGNQFHKFITTTAQWQFFALPWSELPQWPCPNRLEGGIDPSNIRKFEIKFMQGTSYELFIDNIQFYRQR